MGILGFALVIAVSTLIVHAGFAQPASANVNPTSAPTKWQEINSIIECPKVIGPTWSILGTTTKSGNVYIVTTVHCSCAAATWVKRLAAQTVAPRHARPVGAILKGVPSGFTCSASPDSNNHGYSGSCSKGDATAFFHGTGSAFGWGPAR